MTEITIQEALDQAFTRIAELERHVKAIEEALRATQDRELMFLSEIAKENPQVAEFIDEIRQRVLSYPTQGEPPQ